jgi:(2S)-methylsuccinyl-CoA dehydrogenase
VKVALEALGRLVETARGRVRARVAARGLDSEQIAAHGLARLATEVEACRRVALWADRAGGSGPARVAGALVGDVCRSVRGGVRLAAMDAVGLDEMGLSANDVHGLDAPLVADAEVLGAGPCDPDLDADLAATRAQFARFVDAEVRPIAQGIHLRDALVPAELVAKMGALGVFGITVPEEHGGLGLGRVAMCVVTEELTRGYLGVGSIATRSEIAADLVLRGGTDSQKREWLPRIASGACLPTAVFTEPDHGSDLAGIRTRAERQADGSFRVYGQKTWTTHATRADLMTLLARTDPKEPGHGGLSMLLAPKTRRDDGFADEGLTGTEIGVLGYRGMREYELSFDGFRVPAEGLLGGREGAGFKQLMATFESARIHTAARAVGVAQAALDEAARYASQRRQFGRPIAGFPRIARKLARMTVRVHAARQLALHAARRKDSGARCDLEAGMAKLFATEVAWECADACVQIHGGNGYALEFPASRLLVDARVLSIFEGTSEIQAQVIARRLLESGN